MCEAALSSALTRRFQRVTLAFPGEDVKIDYIKTGPRYNLLKIVTSGTLSYDTQKAFCPVTCISRSMCLLFFACSLIDRIYAARSVTT